MDTTGTEQSGLEQMLGLAPSAPAPEPVPPPSVTTSSETPRLDALVGDQIPAPGAPPLPPQGAVPVAPAPTAVVPPPPLDATAAMPAPVLPATEPAPAGGPPISLPDSFFRTDGTVAPGTEDGGVAPPQVGEIPPAVPTAGIMGAPSGTTGVFGEPEQVAQMESGVVAQGDGDFSAIVEGRTPVDLASNTVKRDRTTLRIVLLLSIGVLLVAVAAALLIFLG